MNEIEVKKLYNALIQKGYTIDQIGNENTFLNNMNDENKRRDLYEYVSSKGNFKIGDYDTYESRLTSSIEQSTDTIDPPANPVEDVKQDYTPKYKPRTEEVKEIDMIIEHKTEYATGFGQGFRQGIKGLGHGIQHFGGEVLNLFTGSTIDEEKALERIAELELDGIDIESAIAPLDKVQRQVYETTLSNGDVQLSGITDEQKQYAQIALEKDAINKTIREYIEKAGSLEEAKSMLAERANEETQGDKWIKQAAKGLAELKPTKGFGAWVGNLAPQMIPAAVSIGVGAVTKNPTLTKGVGMVGMGTMTVSTAGMSMNEAREAGATGLQTWAVGIADGAIEFVSEKIPFNRYTSRLLSGVKKNASNQLADAVTNSPQVRNELERLLQEANKKLGGKLFNGKNVKDFVGDIIAEGASEFTAEALQTITPLIYENPEDYPTIGEILRNGWEGAKAGIFMGSVLGGASKTMEHYQQRNRRKEQGFVDIVEFETEDGYKIGESLGMTDRGVAVITDGKIQYVIPEDIIYDHKFSFEEFDRAELQMENEESFDNGYSLSEQQEMNDAKNMLEIKKAEMIHTFGFTDESDIEAFLGENPIETVAQRRQNGESEESTQTIIDYLNAKATYDGMSQRVRDDIDGQIEQSNALIDSHTNKHTGKIHGAVSKEDGRLVYIVSGNVVPYQDGSGIDLQNSDENIIVRDAETGELKQMSPEFLSSLYDTQDPNEQKEINAQQIREKILSEESNKIDGVVDFNDNEQFLNEVANKIAITIILAQRGLDADYIKTFLGNAQIVENPDGTLTFTDGQNEVVVPKQEIQQQVDANNMQRAVDFNDKAKEMRNAIQQATAATTTLSYGMGDNVSLRDTDGNIINGTISMIEDDTYVIDYSDNNGTWHTLDLTKQQLDDMAVERNETGVNDEPVTELSPVDMNNDNTITEQSTIDENIPTTQTVTPSIPKDESGNPIYEQADSETAWDALMEDAEGDEIMAGEVAKSMIADKEAELKKLEKSKIKEGKTPAEKMAALKERKAEVEKIKQDIEAWKKIAAVPIHRQIAQQERIRQEEAEAAAKRKADEERLLAERKEAERKEQELLNGIPDYSEDTPQNARARGYRRVNGHIEERQQPIETIQGKETEIEFSNDARPKGHYAVIDASQLQPSHIQGNRNPLHFLDEAQPKERNDKASIVSAQKIAGNIRPATITTGETAYVGTPTVNTRGEVIQGNSRSDALRLMWNDHQEQGQKYKQYLIDNAEQFGLNPEDVSNMESPVLVRMLDVSDEQAITLGQYVAQDTESGGVERIKPKNAVKKMGDDINSFANMLLDSADEDASFAELLDTNGVRVLKWMAQKGYITDTQYSSAFDTKGSLTAEAKNDLRGIMYQSIFEGGNTRLEEMFNALPAKAQKAILATAHRDFNSPNSERMIEEIQNSIRAFYALMQDEQFAKAKNFKEATKAVEAWQKQYQMDDVTGESYLPSEKFTNFALHLALLYKSEKQSNIQGVFSELYDLIQGTKEGNLFEQADNTPRTLVQAIKETLNIDYNGQRRNNVLVGDNKTSQQGQHGRTGDVASEKRTESREQSADNSGRTDEDSGKRRTTETHSVSEEDKIKLSDPRTMSDEEKQRRGDMLRNAPTVEVQKNAITSTPELSARKAAEKWWDDNVHEPVLYNTEAGEVEINRNSIESSLAHRYGQKKLDAITSLIEGFENAVYLGTMEDGTRQEGVLNHYFAYPIMYNGELNYVFCRAMQDANKNRLYVHEVFLADKIKKGDTLQTAAFQPHGGISLYRDILANILDSNSDKDTTNSPKVKGLEEKVSENNENNSDAIIDKARLGDKDAIETLNSYGIDWQTSTVYRHVAQSEVDALQRGETINGRFDDGRVDVTSSKDVTTASSSDYRVTFKDTFDFGKNKNVRMKNAELGDGWTERGYTLSDVAKIEKRNDDGTYTTIYDANTSTSLNEQIESAEKEVNTSPTDKQKEAGNYKKGHVQIGTFNITIEQPKGSVRSGVDANGKKWETTMHNTYGYIRGTEGVDGDHIDVFLSDDIDSWNGNNVFVVDQYNEDGTFDEHKVMLGFNTIEEAESAYLDNYEKGWEKKHKIVVSPIHTDNFEKWIVSSHRKTKPFAEYKSVKSEENRTKNNENRTKSTENDSKVEESSVKDESKNKTIVEQSKKPSSKIEDFGEKIGGARKDVIRKYADKINVNGTTFGSMFPKPDIDKLIEAGLPIDRVAALKSVYDNAKHEFERSKKHRGKERALRETVFYAVFAKGILSGNEDFELHHEGLVFTEVGVKLVKANIALYQAVFDRLGVEYIKTDLSAYAITPLTEETKKKLNLKSLNEHNGKMQESLAKRKGTEPPVYKDGDLINFIGEKYYNPKDQFETLEEAIDTMVERIGKEVKVGEEIKHTPILYWNVDALGRKDYSKIFIGIKVHGHGIVKLMEFKSSNEANSWIDEHDADFQQMAAAKIEQLKSDKSKPLPKYRIDNIYVRDNNGSIVRYDVYADFGKGIMRPLKSFDIPAKETSQERLRAQSEVYKNEVLPYMNSEEAKQSADEHAKRIQQEKESKNRNYTTERKSRERVGRDWRNGKDATPDMFVDMDGNKSVFGFRAVEFGNYVTNKERQQFLNDIYDALMDMSDVLGVSPRALSLGGQLAIAVGARGKSSASGHYEPEKNVINLTKTSGYGILAHEWLHAFDRYFSNYNPSAIYVGGVQYATSEEYKDDMRQEVKDAFAALMDVIKKSDYYKRSMMLGEYWSSDKELAARALQDHIIRKLNERGQKNEFLSNLTATEDWDGEAENYPFPLGEESERIGEAIDNLFSVIEEKVDEKGNTVMYQKGKLVMDAESEAFRRATERTMKQLESIGIDVEIVEDVAIIEKFENRAIRPNFSRSAGIFYSNAKKAVLDIKQDKATPEQWLKMIEKNGGLKASEDRWLGLSDWLKTQQKRKNIDVQYAKEYDGEAKQIAHGIKEGDISSIDLAAVEMVKLVKDGDILIPIPSRTGKATTSLALANRIAELAGKGKVADVLTGKERESLYNIKKEGKELPKASELEFVLKNQEVLNGNNRVVFVDNVMGTGTTLEAAVELIPNATALVYAKDNSTLSDKKTLTKDEILNFINENSIQIEEVEYEENPSSFDELKDEYERLLREEGYDYAQEVMRDRYGDDFDIAFADMGGELVIDNEEAAATLLGSNNIINSTRLQYTTEGLDNKKEIALVVPTIESYNSHDAVHFGDAGGGRAVAWIRFGETTDKDGKRVLVIDEIQSKRHQDGREKGYRDDKTLTARLDALKESAAKAGMTFNADVRNRSLQFLDLEGKPIGTITRKPTDEQSEIMAQVRNVLFYNDGVPSAPFEKNWQELAMKRMLRYAAENGFDKVAWTTGEQQAERYSLSKAVKKTTVSVMSDNTRMVTLDFRHDEGYMDFKQMRVDEKGTIIGGDFTGSQLSDIVGKEFAIKIMGVEAERETFTDNDLRIGGEGMKGFYDKILPSFVSKYTKKWGGKVEETELPETGLSMHSVDVTPQMKEDVMKGQPMFHKGQMSFDFLNQQDTPLSDTRLRKLEEGETSKIERIFTENKNFDFTSGEKIESIDDVAFIFKQLEDESIENSFAVLVKDGKPTVIHLGMGSYTATGLNGSALNVAVERIQPDKIYFIHNHPSGNLTASRQDIELLNRLKSTYGDIFEDGIIINLRSGKFATFNAEEKNIHDEKNIDNAVPVKVYSFNKQVFEKNYDPAETFKIRSSSDVAKFISSHRLGERPKLGILVCNNQLGVVGNVFTPYTKVTKENAKDIAKDIVYYTTSMGGTCAMMFGNANIYEVGSKRISQHVEDISTGSIKLMDYLNMQKDGSYWSASDEGVSFMRTSSGTIYGWTVDGKVYLTKDGINPNTPVHEYSHLWAEALMKNNPVLWSRIVNGLKDTPVWNEMMLDEEYSSIHHNDNLVASEVLSRLSGTENYRRTMEEAQREIESEKGIFAKAEKITIWERVKQALKDFWNWVVKTYGTNNITPEEAVNMTLKDFWNGVKPKGARSIEAASDIANAEEDDEVLYRSDNEDSLNKNKVNYPAQRRQMVEHAENLAKRLHLDNIEIVNSVSGLEGKKKSAKGFYDPKTGKITIVIPNNTSIADIEKTLLHEAVAHYGLRQLFGEHFDTFLDNVYNNADESIRKRIAELAIRKYNYDFRKATEEYLASLAESTNFENAQQSSWWQKVKDFFADMLSKLGFKDFRGVTLTDNELRYILWRSYENLSSKRHEGVFGQAADIAKQYELGVGDYAKSSESEDDVLFRDGDPEIHEKELVRDKYDRRIKAGWYQSKEAFQDSMLSLKEAMKDIAGMEIEDIDGFENAYLGENRLSSVNKAEADAFARLLFKPMLDEVAKLAPTAAERQELVDYMMAKHGLERNEYMRQQAMQNGEDANRDFAGLTSLTGFDDITAAEAEAQIMVNEYEQNHDSIELWDNVNAVSKAILSKTYECGLIDKDTFENISNMYEFYIPLRGFEEKTSDEAYAYLSHIHNAFNAPIKKAEGRTSKADDPFAYLQSMAESAIMQGNRNKLVKQRFLNFVLNHPSDLVSISELWLEYDNVDDEWRPVFPDNIDTNDSGEVVEQKMKDFDEKMELLSQNEPDRYKKGRDAIGIPYRVVEKRDLQQHQVIVKRNGRDVVLTVNGNPRLAQALNGQTNPDNDMSGAIGTILRSGEWVNRQLSAFYTTRNPDFIVSNFLRDMLYSNSMAWIKESPNYALRFNRNYMIANPITMKRLLNKYRKGTLDTSDKIEGIFYQFMMNGGETGYANVRDIEQHKNDIRKELRRSNGRLKIGRALSLLAERFDELNRAIENCARFAAFMTSKEMGRTTDRAIYDAKEISVNFNKKGSGSKFYGEIGQTVAGNTSSLISGLGRSSYVFWNAAIQGTTNFGRQIKRHPAKAFTGIASMFLLGALVAFLGGDDDDDDNKNSYYNLPEYVRRSNILFRAGEHWISIPLPVEYRAIYGLGELMTSTISGKEHLTDSEIAEAIIGQMSQVLPLDFMEGGGGLNALVPSAVKPLWEAYVAEKSWTGLPLYKDTPYNKNMPEWTKAYSSANKHIVNLTASLNEVTGGDRYTKGNIDINPSKIEYVLKGYFGGVFNTIDKMAKMAETATGEREYDPQNFLLLNRVVKAGDERTEYRAVNNEYFRLKKEHDDLKSRIKNYENDTYNGIFDYANKIDFLYNSPEYQRYEIFELYKKEIESLNDMIKNTYDNDERKELETYLNEIKKEMIEEMNKTRKRA